MLPVERLFTTATQRQIPLKNTVEILSACHMRCVHCYVTHQKPGVLTLEVLQDLFAQIAQAGGLYLTLTGGEIALRRDLWEIVAAARKHHFLVQLLSSGTLWSEKDLDRVAKLGVDSVRLSIYGANAQVHERVTQKPGSFAATMQTAQGLLSRNVTVVFAASVLRENVHEAAAIKNFAEQWGIDVAFSTHIAWTDQGRADTAQHAANARDLTHFFAEQHRFAPNESETPCSTFEDDAPCGVGQYSTYIQSDGNVLPCVRWPYPAGNILEQTFTEIWKTSKVFQYARGLRNRDLATCHACGDREVCGPCAGMNLTEHGNVAAPSPTVCRTAQARSITTRGYSAQSNQAGHHPALPIVP